MPHLPGCSDILAIQALVDSATDFCNLSMVLRERLPAINTIPKIGAYDPGAPAFHSISRITKVWLSDVELTPIVAQSVGVTPLVPQKPTNFFVTRDGGDTLVNLLPFPDAVYTLEIEAVLRPSRSASQFNDVLFDIWMEPILEGAKARLMEVPDQPFSNMNESKKAAAKAFYLTQKARVDGSYGRVLGGMRVSPVRFT